MKILIVEDDSNISSALSYSLEKEGYTIMTAATVAEAKNCIIHDIFSLCLLDLTLPDGSGYDVCRAIKERSDTPIIFLTACDDEVNVVMGLDMGADDYITKPFRIRELISRIQSVLRRYQKKNDAVYLLQFEDIKINTLEAKVYRGTQEILLTALEYRLLLVFANNPGQILSRNQLLEGIWDVSGDFVNDNTLTVYIKRLRQKLETEESTPPFIVTVRGLGYRIGEEYVKK